MNVQCLTRESHEQTDNYITVNRQTRGQQPLYENIQPDQRYIERQKVRRQNDHVYENTAVDDAQ